MQMVSERQVGLHIASEAVAVALIAPFLLSLSRKEQMTEDDRKILKGIAIATLVVDGWLLYRWLR